MSGRSTGSGRPAALACPAGHAGGRGAAGAREGPEDARLTGPPSFAGASWLTSALPGGPDSGQGKMPVPLPLGARAAPPARAAGAAPNGRRPGRPVVMRPALPAYGAGQIALAIAGRLS